MGELTDPITRDNLPDGDWREFRKRGTTSMLRMDGPFTVVTREGPLSCPDGWLAVDRAGWPYPIAADEQRVTYTPKEIED